MEIKKSEVEELKAKIYGAFSMCSQTDVNFAAQILELILEQGENVQSQLLQYVCEIWGTVKSSKEIEVPERISKAQYEKLKSLYGEMVDASLLSYTRKGLSEGWSRETFYSQLWQFVCKSIMWNNMEEKAFVLYYIAIDTRTPYYNVGTGLKMNNDDYHFLQNEVFESYREFRFIAALDFGQRTEEASLILNIINRMDTEEQKVVFISKIIGYYHDEIERIISKVRNG